jgi:hypothetical protein
VNRSPAATAFGESCQVSDPESKLIQLAKVLDPSLLTAQSIACLPDMVRTRLKVRQPRADRHRGALHRECSP